jgi:DNA polymerase
MSWTTRQLAMLREMGLTLWWPGAAPRGLDAARQAPAAEPTPEAEAVTQVVAPPRAAAQAAPATPRAPTPPRPTAPATVTTAPADAPRALRPLGVETMDWPALREAVAGCQACKLCEGRRNTVFGVGHEQAHWMVIGEAPGEQEDREGQPFVGKAGQLLDRMLEATGLTRAEAPPAQQVFIANVLKCRPPGNRNPLPEEVAQCEPYLKRQVELVRPKIILAMGRFAVQSILQTQEPIGKLRGRVHSYAGVPVIVTYHPAYLLRSLADKALAWEDLCLAREVLSQQA